MLAENPSKRVFVTDKNIIIPSSYNGISVTQIKENGFKGITALESVVLPEGIVKIGKYAFSACTNLELTIPESVKTIDPHALYNVKTITVRGTNSWSVTGVSWTEYFGDTLIDYGNNQNFSEQEISASSYSRSVAIAPTRGGSSAYKSPWTGTWTR